MNNTFDKDDLEIDDLSQNLNKKKKIKSGSKGKRGESLLVNELNARFANLISANQSLGAFSRSVGSGNRWGQKVILSKVAANTYAGDITCPDNFLFVLESKNGYNDVDLFNCFSGKCPELDAFLKQITDDSLRSGRKPMLIWKKDRKEKIAFLKLNDIDYKQFPIFIVYNDWVGINLNYVLSMPDSFFFKS